VRAGHGLPVRLRPTDDPAAVKAEQRRLRFPGVRHRAGGPDPSGSQGMPRPMEAAGKISSLLPNRSIVSSVASFTFFLVLFVFFHIFFHIIAGQLSYLAHRQIKVKLLLSGLLW
jgi:hypothetical protein